MKFYCAIAGDDKMAWQEGEQTIDPDTGEIQPIGFQPDFVAEWDGSSPYYIPIYGTLPIIPERSFVDDFGATVTIPAFVAGIPYSGWPMIDKATWEAAQPAPE